MFCLKFCFGVGFPDIGKSQKIVSTGIVEACQSYEHIRRNITPAYLVIRIAYLGAFQIVGDLFLQKVPVLPHIAYSSVHTALSFFNVCYK